MQIDNWQTSGQLIHPPLHIKHIMKGEEILNLADLSLVRILCLIASHAKHPTLGSTTLFQ